MYVILKGKISVSVCMPNRPEIQSVISMCNDGDCFGELALFDFSKISVDSSSFSNKPTMRRRGGTCVAVEESFLLRISHEHARDILQPSAFTLKLREERSRTTLLSSPRSVASKVHQTTESEVI